MSLRDPGCDCLPGEMPFPLALDPFYCHRFEIAKFAREVYALGVKYLGVCCGAMPHQIRSMAEALGRTPPGSACSPDIMLSCGIWMSQGRCADSLLTSPLPMKFFPSRTGKISPSGARALPDGQPAF